MTEFPQIYGRTIDRSKEEIFLSCLELAPSRNDIVGQQPASTNLVEFVVHQRCDVSKLTPETLLALNNNWEAIGAFKDSLEKMTADIPPGIGDPNILHQRLREKADKMFAKWKEDNINRPQSLKDLFSGDTDEAGKALGKLVEKAVGEGAAGATGAVGGSGLITTLSGAARLIAVAACRPSWLRPWTRQAGKPWRRPNAATRIKCCGQSTNTPAHHRMNWQRAWTGKCVMANPTASECGALRKRWRGGAWVLGKQGEKELNNLDSRAAKTYPLTGSAAPIGAGTDGQNNVVAMLKVLPPRTDTRRDRSKCCSDLFRYPRKAL